MQRIGQKKEVRILRLVTERSVEEQVMAGASRKIEMDKKVRSLVWRWLISSSLIPRRRSSKLVATTTSRPQRSETSTSCVASSPSLRVRVTNPCPQRALLDVGDEEVEEDDELDEEIGRAHV